VEFILVNKYTGEIWDTRDSIEAILRVMEELTEENNRTRQFSIYIKVK